MYPVFLHKKLYNKKKLIGFNITIIRYSRDTTRCGLQTINIDTRNMLLKLNNKEIMPINFVLWNNGVIAINKYDNAKHIIKETAIKMRKFLEVHYGTGTDLCGHCIEASEYLEKILRLYGLKDIKQVEGYCLWENEDYGSDRPYGEHTWLELGNGKYYLDITADQFNQAFFGKEHFKPIEFRCGVPKEMMHTEPVEGYDYWVDC